MNKDSNLTFVDYTALKAVTNWETIKTLCEEALAYKTASVCIPASYVRRVHKSFPELNICTVIGFPLGYTTTASKVYEARDALGNGAGEIDMVVNLGDVKNGDFAAVTSEIASVKRVCGKHIFKVIVETCYLTTEEKIALCKCVTDGGADFIKTSTGFGTDGAKLEDIKLFREHIGSGVRIKAAGGIRTAEELDAFCRAGCSRIGCSTNVKVLSGEYISCAGKSN